MQGIGRSRVYNVLVVEGAELPISDGESEWDLEKGIFKYKYINIQL